MGLKKNFDSAISKSRVVDFEVTDVETQLVFEYFDVFHVPP